MVSDSGNGEMHFTRMGQRAGGDRIEARWKFSENPRQGVRAQAGWREFDERIDDFPAGNELPQLVLRFITKKEPAK